MSVEDWRPFCHECNGLGTVRCECGGDLCVCGMEEMPCHSCYPGEYTQDEEDLDYEVDQMEQEARK